MSTEHLVMPDWLSPHAGAEWALLPKLMRNGIDRYMRHGIVTGHFLTALLENRFVEACARADDHNRYLLPIYGSLLSNGFPARPHCWGSREAVETWQDLGGLEGIRRPEGWSQADLDSETKRHTVRVFGGQIND